MQLGVFSLSLSVKDLERSKVFYAKLGFEQTGGDEAQGWLILKNGTTVIGLFKGMFERNTLTFNPGWDADGAEVDPFTDVRELGMALRAAGVEPLVDGTLDSDAGPAHLIVVDPDGNPILIDQHR